MTERHTRSRGLGCAQAVPPSQGGRRNAFLVAGIVADLPIL